MTVTVEQVKCACTDCVCIVSVGKAVEAEGRTFCSDACAQHHSGGTGCEHAGCACHG